MNRRFSPCVAAILLIGMTTGCAPSPISPPVGTPAPTTAGSSTPSASTPSPAMPEAESPEQIVGTVVRFTSDRTTVDVNIGEDSPGVRDFLSLLPLELTVEEYAGAEKLAYLPRELDYAGSPGTDPEDGDLIYYTPWGNLGFYYDATGIDYSDDTLHIGTFSANEDQLSLLEGGPVTITTID